MVAFIRRRLEWVVALPAALAAVWGLTGVLDGAFAFTDAARLSFVPVQAMLVAGFTVLVAVPLARMRRAVTKRRA